MIVTNASGSLRRSGISDVPVGDSGQVRNLMIAPLVALRGSGSKHRRHRHALAWMAVKIARFGQPRSVITSKVSSLSSPESVTSNLHSGSLGKYLLSRVNQSERARVRQALGAPADTVFADQLGWCNDPREKCNPALGTTVEYQPWEKRINVYETSDVTKIKPVTDPNRTVWRYNGVGKALTKLSSASSSNSPPSASPNSGVLSAPANILKQMGPGWYLGDKNGTVQAQIHTFARASSGKNATIALTVSLNAGNYRIYNASKQNTAVV